MLDAVYSKNLTCVFWSFARKNGQGYRYYW
jgi:hypothetical protein